MKDINNSVSSEGVVSATTQENEKVFYPLLDAKGCACDLVSKCINSTVNGYKGVKSPYYYGVVDSAISIGIGISFHYDENIGLQWALHTVDKKFTSELSDEIVELFTEWGELDNAKSFFAKEYVEYLNYVDEVAQWVEYYMTRQSDKPRFLIEDVEKHQISKDEAKTLTNYLYVEKCIK